MVWGALYIFGMVVDYQKLLTVLIYFGLQIKSRNSI